MKNDPFTLLIALDKEGSANGELYLDDGESYAHEEGYLVWRQLFAQDTPEGLVMGGDDLVNFNPDRAVDQTVLAEYSTDNAFAKSISKVRIEKIIVLGMNKKPRGVLNEGIPLEFTWEEGVAFDGDKEGKASVLVIKNPGAFVVQKWGILAHY
jgi:alpha 1,3-glucosidase